jgi:hypothetical protein
LSRRSIVIAAITVVVLALQSGIGNVSQHAVPHCSPAATRQNYRQSVIDAGCICFRYDTHARLSLRSRSSSCSRFVISFAFARTFMPVSFPSSSTYTNSFRVLIRSALSGTLHQDIERHVLDHVNVVLEVQDDVFRSGMQQIIQQCQSLHDRLECTTKMSPKLCLP